MAGSLRKLEGEGGVLLMLDMFLYGIWERFKDDLRVGDLDNLMFILI